MGPRENALGQLDRLAWRVEVEFDAAAIAARADLQRAAEGRRESVLRRRERLGQVWVHLAPEALPLRLRLTLSFTGGAFRLTHRPAAVAGIEREPAAHGVVLAQQDRAAVALAQGARLDQLESVLREVQQPDEVRDSNAAATDAATHLLLRQPEVVDEHRARAGLLDRVEVHARHVLGEREVEPLPVVGVA